MMKEICVSRDFVRLVGYYVLAILLPTNVGNWLLPHNSKRQVLIRLPITICTAVALKGKDVKPIGPGYCPCWQQSSLHCESSHVRMRLSTTRTQYLGTFPSNHVTFIFSTYHYFDSVPGGQSGGLFYSRPLFLQSHIFARAVCLANCNAVSSELFRNRRIHMKTETRANPESFE